MKKSVCLVSALFLSLTACSTQAHVSDLMSEITANPLPNQRDITENGSMSVTDFTLDLFQQEFSDQENTLLSPLSVLYVLAMCANGAKGNTLAQMEAVLGLPLNELNSYLNAFRNTLPKDSKYKLDIADSIWFKDDENLKVKRDFLQINADTYGAGSYQAPFDKSTLKAINNWVSENTDGMIKEILNEISPDALMYLINAVAFDAQWQNKYTESQVTDGTFTCLDGSIQKIKLMHSNEYSYLSDEHASGFIKYYADQKYAFAALLPNENVDFNDYVASLDGSQLRNLLSHDKNIEVNTAMPKFEVEYSSALSETLIAMGLSDAFDANNADFTGITDQNELVINEVMHKSYIAVNEQGTKAGAVTAAEMTVTSAMAEPQEVKEVILNRPFLFMLIECQNNVPIFIGSAVNIK